MTYQALDGILFSHDGTMLVHYPEGNKRIYYRIPETVMDIKPNAFGCCLMLESIVVPAGVKEVDASAFVRCPHLSAIYFLGDAPKDGKSFSNIAALSSFSERTTIYYRPHTKGWGKKCWGCSTAVWNGEENK